MKYLSSIKCLFSHLIALLLSLLISVLLHEVTKKGLIF